MTSEISRQLVHILVGGGALLLRWLTWWQAAAFAASAVLFNVYVLPRVAPRVFRPGDLRHLTSSGIVIYPIAVLALVLCFPTRLDIAATAWVILAVGDGFATLIGRHTTSPPLSWNRQKSVNGLVAFVVSAALAGVAVAAWMNHSSGVAPAWWIAVAPCAAALVAGFVETTPIRLNDNISVPATAALVLWSLSLIDDTTMAAQAPDVLARLLPAAALNLLAAAAGWRAGSVTIAGALAGWTIGTIIFAFAGWPAWMVLIFSFVIASAATRAGYARKARVGIAEERGGRRGPGNALANTGVAAWLAVMSAGMMPADLARLAMVAALDTALSDTIASEVGKAWGRTTWLVTSWRQVAPGTSGAISAEGTVGGALGAAAIGAVAAVGGLIPPIGIVEVAGAATIASLIEGALGATLEDAGVLDNHTLNFVNSLAGAALAVLAAGWRL